MQMRVRDGVLPIVVFTLAACVTNISAAAPIPIEVWRVGDDGLTVRLADALQNEVERNKQFVRATALDPQRIVIKINRNVAWASDGDRDSLQYDISVLKNDIVIADDIRGECLVDRLASCSKVVMRVVGERIATK